VRDNREQVDQLAALMDEFNLAEASLNLGGFQVSFSRHQKPSPVPTGTPLEEHPDAHDPSGFERAPMPEVAKGHPVSSPMAGIFYMASSPGSPPFVKIGDTVAHGQTVGLIEAMKVFNEIPSPLAGTVLEILVESGALVQPGEVILRIG
jgi:acetyl-CoA carboxylase biotin carboxyl carrier protein